MWCNSRGFTVCVLGKRFLKKPRGGLCTSSGRAGWNVGTQPASSREGAQAPGSTTSCCGSGQKRKEMLGSFPNKGLYLEVH